MLTLNEGPLLTLQRCKYYQKHRTLSNRSYGPWGATNLGECRIGETIRVVRRKVGKVLVTLLTLGNFLRWVVVSPGYTV